MLLEGRGRTNMGAAALGGGGRLGEVAGGGLSLPVSCAVGGAHIPAASPHVTLQRTNILARPQAPHL